MNYVIWFISYSLYDIDHMNHVKWIMIQLSAWQSKSFAFFSLVSIEVHFIFDLPNIFVRRNSPRIIFHVWIYWPCQFVFDIWLKIINSDFFQTITLCCWLFSLCWWIFQCIKSVINISQLSPIHFVANICHQHRSGRILPDPVHEI